MFRRALFVLLLALVAVPAVAQSFVFLSNGAMVPCDHPLAIAESKGCQVSPPPPPTVEPPSDVPLQPGIPRPDKPFRLGRSYMRPMDGQRIHISALGQLKGGWYVWHAECLNTNFPDPCPAVGKIWTIVANASAADWVEEP